MGQMVEHRNVDNHRTVINTSGLHTGMYVVTIMTDKGIESKKIVIQ
jgi:hypothetical protein